MKTRYARGYKAITGWMVLVQVSSGKRWHSYRRDQWETAGVIWAIILSLRLARVGVAVRLLGPGGIIAAELLPDMQDKPHGGVGSGSSALAIEAKHAPTYPNKRKLISPGVLRPSIVAPAVARTFFLQDMPSKG